MKFRILMHAVIFAALPMIANATNYPPPKPDPKPPVHKPRTNTNTNSNTSSSKSAAEAAAAAAAAAKAKAAAELNSDIDVDSSLSNESPSSASVQDSSSINARSWSLFVPPSVFTPPMPRPEVPMGCPAPTETQSALEVGKGVVFSKADSFRDNSPCTAIKYSQLLWDRCQYKKADRALSIGLKLFAKTAGEDWDASANPDLIDYKVSDCAVLQNPATVNNHYVTNYVQDAPKKPAIAPCPKGQKRNSKGVCYLPTPPCEEGKILACQKKS